MRGCLAGGADGFVARAAAGSWDAELLRAGHMDFLDWGPQGASGGSSLLPSVVPAQAILSSPVTHDCRCAHDAALMC